jgi:hypothetical protein
MDLIQPAQDSVECLAIANMRIGATTGGEFTDQLGAY